MGTACGLELPGQRQRPNAEPSVPPPVQPWGVATVQPRRVGVVQPTGPHGVVSPACGDWEHGFCAMRARWGRIPFDRARWGRIPFDRAGAFRSRAVALQPAKRAAAYSQGRKPLDSRPTLPLEPPKGAAGRPPRTRVGRPFGACDPLLGAGIPRLPPGAIGGRLLPEPDDTRPGLNTAGTAPGPHTGPAFMPQNRCSCRGPVSR